MVTTIYIRQNDLLPYLDFTLVKDTDNTPHDLTGATVTFIMANKEDRTVIINKKAMTIISALLGQVRYTLEAADVVTEGTYYAEVEVVFSNGKILTFPEKEYLTVEIKEELA